MNGPTTIQEVVRLAERLVRSGTAEDSAMFRQLLEQISDTAALSLLAEQFTPHPEVSIPAWERLLKLEPESAGARVGLATLNWLVGEDEIAASFVQAARSLDPDRVDAMLLQAALTKDVNGKLALYREVLTRDPLNRDARHNLKILGFEVDQ